MLRRYSPKISLPSRLVARAVLSDQILRFAVAAARVECIMQICYLRVLLLLLFNCCFFIQSQRKEFYQNFRHQIDTVNDKVIALTFDDGPHEILTPRLLDVLKKYNVSCTFYVMGIKVKMHPEIIKRAVDEGHEIGNHGWDHPVMSKISRELLHDQINTTNLVINKAINMNPATMRPPYSLTYSPTHLLTHLLTHSPTHSPTHSLTYSLTYSLTHLGMVRRMAE